MNTPALTWAGLVALIAVAVYVVVSVVNEILSFGALFSHLMK